MATPETFSINSIKPVGSGRFYHNVDTDQGKFVYVPSEFVFQGLRQKDNQYFEKSFLNQEYLDKLKSVQLDPGLVTSELKKAGYQNPGSGFLISDADFNKYDLDSENISYYSAKGKYAGPVKGIAQLGDELVYSFEGAGGSTYGYVDKKGTPTETTITITPGKKRFGKLGEWAGDIAGAFAEIPFGAEIAGLLSGNPALYASLKSLQTAGSGGDLEDTLKAGAKAYATAVAAGEVGKSIAGTPTGAGVEPGAGVDVYPVDPGVTPDITSIPGTPSLPPVDYGLLGGTNAYDAGIGLEVMNPPPAAPPMTAEQLAASNIDPLTREGMSAEQVRQEAIDSPYYRAAQSNIDPSILEGMSAEQVASSPVLTSAALSSGAAATIGLSDAVRGLRTASNVYNALNPSSAGGGGGGGVDYGGAQPTMSGVDYAGLYNLLAQRAAGSGLLGTRYQPQSINLASLLG
jgi:hypothetical protein